jgi:hypothetical protein
MAVLGAADAGAEGWEFTLTPYAWLAGVDGQLGAVPGFPAADISLSFKDVLEDLDYAGFLTGAARNGPWVLLLDTSLVQTTATQKIGGAAVNSVEVRSRTANLALGVGRRVAAGPQYTLEAYAAARWWSVENEFTVKLAGGGSESRDSDASWIDPLIGGIYRRSFDDRWSLLATAEVGGFGIGSDLTWGGIAAVNYAMSDWADLTVGYRYLSVDYDSDGFVYDVAQSGPLIGIRLSF